MFKKYLLYLILFNSAIYAQTAVSGHLDLNSNTESEQRIYLYKLNVEGLRNPTMAKEVVWSTIGADGSYSFDSKHLSTQDAIYQLYLNGLFSEVNDTIAASKPFILSNRDKINFESGAKPFENYRTTNRADEEWKYLQDFEQDLQESNLEAGEDITHRKRFIKDSLHILIVKLIGVQHLEDKRLLEQDIDKNACYYLSLLEELKESELPSSEYEFLEKKLAFLTQVKIEQKYALSKVIILILFLLIVGLMYVIFYRRTQPITLVDLSKQEQTIKKLILEGKSNKEIANELFISLSTVKTHITSIYSKLQVTNRQELLQKSQN